MAYIVNSPKIIQFAGGKARSTVTRTAMHSATFYYGSFVSDIYGTDAAPTGSEGGIQIMADDRKIYGFVTGFRRQGGSIPIGEDTSRKGTYTTGSGQLPDKYAFSAANDEVASATPDLEQVEIMPIEPGDILEVTLWGAAALPVVRGTTTAAGTTTSSANSGVSMSVDTTYTFALTESTAAVNAANLDFMTVDIIGRKPVSPYRVYAKCIRKTETMTVPE